MSIFLYVINLFIYSRSYYKTNYILVLFRPIILSARPSLFLTEQTKTVLKTIYLQVATLYKLDFKFEIVLKVHVTFFCDFENLLISLY